jgi:holo-[acyl-carrier protein] synthase
VDRELTAEGLWQLVDDREPDVRPVGDHGLSTDLGTGELIGRVVVAIGADLVDIDRMRDVIARQPGFATRVFTADERAYCDKRNDPAERYAARFAAKEAVLKVLGTGLGGADFSDIEVVRLESGKPELRISGRAADKAAELGIGGWLITMSHSDHVAQVFVAGLGVPKP